MKNLVNGADNAKLHRTCYPSAGYGSLLLVALTSVAAAPCLAQTAQPEMYILKETILGKSGSTVGYGVFCKKNDKGIPLKSAEAKNGILETVEFGSITVGPPSKADPQFFGPLKKFCGE